MQTCSMGYRFGERGKWQELRQAATVQETDGASSWMKREELGLCMEGSGVDARAWGGIFQGTEKIETLIPTQPKDAEANGQSALGNDHDSISPWELIVDASDGVRSLR